MRSLFPVFASTLIVALQFVSATIAHGQIFSDEFNRTQDPVGGGWVDFEGDSPPLNVDVTQAFDADGEVRFTRPGGTGNSSGTIDSWTRSPIISTVGYTGITLNANGRENGNPHEGSDDFSIQVDYADGAGFQTVFSDTGPFGNFNVVNQALAAAADENPYLRVRFAAENNAGSDLEQYFVDAVSIDGTLTGTPNTASAIFADDGSVDPAANGWTVFEEGVMDVSSDGDNIVFSRPVNQPQEDASITRTVDTTGFDQIAIEFFAETSGGFEAADNIAIRYDLDDGNGFIDLFADTDPDESPFDLLLALPPGAADNPNLSIQFFANFNAAAEFINIDTFNVLGVSTASTAIPEPASLAVWSMLGLALAGFCWRRQRR